jgi:hypothetical protein
MSWGWAGEGSHFFRRAELVAQGCPDGFSFVAELWDDERDEPSVFRYLPEGFVLEYCDAMRENQEERAHLAESARRAFWWLRNRRWSGGGTAGYVRSVEAAETALLTCVQLLELGGADPRDIWDWLSCGMHACVCDGCDLHDGRRFGPG